MDGHHRFFAAKQLGLSAIPALLLSYEDPLVRLECWRPGETITAEQVREVARSGALLPYKTTRHIVAHPIPDVRVQLDELRQPAHIGLGIAPAGPYPSRPALMIEHYRRLTADIGVRADASDRIASESAVTLSPHPLVRQAIEADPAMAALLAASPCHLALGQADEAPFVLRRNNLLRVAPGLLEEPAALAAAVRWGIEAAFMRQVAPNHPPLFTHLLAHGMALIGQLSSRAREVILRDVPRQIGMALLTDRPENPSPALLAWLAERFEGAQPSITPEPALSELNQPVEMLLVQGGDSRLVIDPATGANRYGATPRPRPEAIHFSSSTASSVSDYGFLACDMLRRDLLSAHQRQGIPVADLQVRAADAIGLELLRLLRLDPTEADVILAPSGTDLELIAVLLSLAATPEGQSLGNLLIAPEETGRGVPMAAQGCSFDEIAATGAPIRKGQAFWPERRIQVSQTPIRNEQGEALPLATVNQAAWTAATDLLQKNGRLLMHLLASSKTGLAAPENSVADRLLAEFGDRVDVVMDACQMRQDPAEMGGWVRRGWMVQISGSKFLTGPPFSGALVIPIRMRNRVAAVAKLMASAPGATRREDWNAWWRPQLPAFDGPPASFGTIMRWLPALVEAQLLAMLPEAQRLHVFHRFRSAVRARIQRSAWLNLLTLEDEGEVQRIEEIATRSIVCFSVQTERPDGQMRPLTEAECTRIFRLLNRDVTADLGPLQPMEHALARQAAHIGQPVRLRADDGVRPSTILRLVIGARFFNTVGHAGPSSIEAALEGEIADAIRAIEKLELLARHWWRLAEDGK